MVILTNDHPLYSIGKGLMLLVGINTKDTSEDVAKLSKKLLGLRVFEDLSNPPDTKTKWEGRPWAKSLIDDSELQVLSVSQFTLYGTLKKGTKPDFHRAAKGHHAVELYDEFLQTMRTGLGDESRVLDGQFGAMMDVQLTNDGPVTLIWDTQDPGW